MKPFIRKNINYWRSHYQTLREETSLHALMKAKLDRSS